MKVTITQIDCGQLESEWEALRAHVAAKRSKLVLLPEMIFAPWFCAAPERDDATWHEAVDAHERWLTRLPELGADIIVGTAPRNIGGSRFNCAYLWTRAAPLRWIHQKTYLPQDEGYWEARWYDRAPVEFTPAQARGLSLGVMICTDLWFMEHARQLGKSGIHLLLNPRSTPSFTNAKWLAGGRTAAVVAGAYCLSSNHAGFTDGLEHGGCGWLSDPEGDLLATTSADQPFITGEIDLALAERAKSTYPRNVDDRPL